MILFVRHAQSAANVDLDALHATPDVSIPLTELGHQQAAETGAWLADSLWNMCFDGTAVVWNSPFLRTRQTADHIKNALRNHEKRGHAYPIQFQERENHRLIERQFGLIATHEPYFDDERTAPFVEHYNKHSSKEAFFCKPPLGESPMDMVMRLEGFVDKYLQNEQLIHIIVSHGAAIRGLNMVINDLPYESFHAKTPANASVTRPSSNGLYEMFCPSVRT